VCVSHYGPLESEYSLQLTVSTVFLSCYLTVEHSTVGVSVKQTPSAVRLNPVRWDIKYITHVQFQVFSRLTSGLISFYSTDIYISYISGDITVSQIQEVYNDERSTVPVDPIKQHFWMRVIVVS